MTSKELNALFAAANADHAAPHVDTITINEDAHLVPPPSTLVHSEHAAVDRLRHL